MRAAVVHLTEVHGPLPVPGLGAVGHLVGRDGVGQLGHDV